MSRWSRVFHGQTTIDFVGLRKRWFVISGVLVLVSLGGLLLKDLNLGLEFEGGVAVQAANPAGASIEEVRRELSDIGRGDARIQLVDDGHSVRIQTGPLDPDAEEEMVATLVDVTGTTRDETSIDAVGPTFGALVARQALIALGAFLGIAVLFISWRLQWKMAIAGLVALAHDVIITAGIYDLSGIQVTPATVVALLTILGYSLYDTVVVFDKVEELEGPMTEEHTYTEIVNTSMNTVLVRSLATSLTSLLPVGSLLFVGAVILGARSLQDFALALFIGIAVGTYSSIFVAAPFLAAWKEREPFWTEHRTSLARRSARGKSAPAPPADTKPKAETKVETKTKSESADEAVAAPTVTPRPPKKRRR